MNKKAFSFILALAAATNCLLTTTASAAPSAKCDTTNNFGLLQDASYQFLITASSKPNFVVGNSKILSLVKSSKKGNHYFYTVKAVGRGNEAAGVYVNGIRQCVVSIKAPTVANGVAGTDGAANEKWIADNLGFYYNEAGCYYNPVNKARSCALITMGSAMHLTTIGFRVWNADTKAKAKRLFQFYLPNSYERLYNIMNDWDNGSDAYEAKHFTLDNRDIIFYWFEDAGELQLQIGDKYVSAKTIYDN